MYGPLALILVAVGAFLAFVVWRSVRPDDDQVKGFAIVGAVVMIMLAAVVVVIGLLAPPDGMAETLGLIALFGLPIYLAVALVVIMIARRLPPPQHPPDGQPRGYGAGHPADHGSPDQP